MRGFTAFTEAHAPTETLAMLNTLFGALGKEIVDRQGTIDKFIGDSIMAFWNAPVDVADHPRRAAEAALAMRTRLEALNTDGGLSGIAIGIGDFRPKQPVCLHSDLMGRSVVDPQGLRPASNIDAQGKP